jgi:hypothetical protein
MANPGWETSFGSSPYLFINRKHQRMTHPWAGEEDSTRTLNGNNAILYDEPRSTGLNEPNLYFLLGYMGPDGTGTDTIAHAITFNVYNPAAQPQTQPGGGETT